MGVTRTYNFNIIMLAGRLWSEYTEVDLFLMELIATP